MKAKIQKLSLKNLRDQCRNIASRFNAGEDVSAIDVFSVLEQLIIALDESQLPAEHQHIVEVKSGNVILK